MTVSTEYNEVKDLAAVEQFGFINLVDSLAKGYVPEEISNTEDAYNGIEDPSEIIGKPRDRFEAYRMMDSIKAAAPAESE